MQDKEVFSSPLPCVLLPVEELEVQGFAPLARSADAAPAYTAALSLRPVFLFETGRSPEGGYGSQPTMRTSKKLLTVKLH